MSASQPEKPDMPADPFQVSGEGHTVYGAISRGAVLADQIRTLAPVQAAMAIQDENVMSRKDLESLAWWVLAECHLPGWQQDAREQMPRLAPERRNGG